MPSTLPKPGLLISLKSFLRPIKRFPKSLLTESCGGVESLEVWKGEGKEKTTGFPLTLVYAGLERHKNYFFHMAFQPQYAESVLKKGRPEEILREVNSRGF